MNHAADAGAHRYRTLLWTGLVLLVALILGVVVLNPLDLLTRRAAQFSLEDFKAIKVGEKVEDVIARLGEPVKVVRLPEAVGCEGCSAHYFLGGAPTWVVFETEAWVVVGPDGRVRQAVINREP